jgi:hypothetical protein
VEDDLDSLDGPLNAGHVADISFEDVDAILHRR